MNERFNPGIDYDRPVDIKVSGLCDGATIKFNTTFSLRGELSVTYALTHSKEDGSQYLEERRIHATHSTEPQILAMLLMRLVQGPAQKNPIELFDEIMQTVFPDQSIPEDTEIDNTYPTRRWVSDRLEEKIEKDDVLKNGLELDVSGGGPTKIVLRPADDGILFIKKTEVDSEDVWLEDISEDTPDNSTMEFEETEVFTIDDTDLMRVAAAVAKVGLLGRAKEQIVPTLRGLIDSQGA